MDCNVIRMVGIVTDDGGLVDLGFYLVEIVDRIDAVMVKIGII
jgi:hypothetical protein